MKDFEQFIGKDYYEVYDSIQAVALDTGLYTCLIEDDLDYNIDHDSLRVKVYVDYNKTIVKVKKG